MASEPEFVGRKDPQISANDLALYMVSSATTQLSIVRRNKYPSKHPTRKYQDVKRKLIKFLADPSRDLTALVEALQGYEAVEKDPSSLTSTVEQARLSKAVLDAFLQSQNQVFLVQSGSGRKIEHISMPHPTLKSSQRLICHFVLISGFRSSMCMTRSLSTRIIGPVGSM